MAAERWVRAGRGVGSCPEVPAPLAGCRVPSQHGAGEGLRTHLMLWGLGGCQPLPTLPCLFPTGFPLWERMVRQGMELRSGARCP